MGPFSIVLGVCALDAPASSPDEPVWAACALVVSGLVLYALVGRGATGA